VVYMSMARFTLLWPISADTNFGCTPDLRSLLERGEPGARDGMPRGTSVFGGTEAGMVVGVIDSMTMSAP
jgi:hypothetical protein